MTKIRAAIAGYGNIGRYALQALEASPDFEVAGIVRRRAANTPPELAGYTVTDDVAKLEGVDVAILCIPTRETERYASKMLASGINTVDSYDIHGGITALRASLDVIARANGRVAVVSAGWDPGSDSVVRALLEAAAPAGITHTDFGPGMSMGHTVCARSKAGVRDALSITIPVGAGIHRRMVYVEPEPGASMEEIAAAIRSDPYFSHDETRVVQTEDVGALKDMGHGVKIVRRGVSGATHNQTFEFGMRINNPALTAQILVSAARASMRQRPGAYTLIEIPPVDLLPGGREELIGRLV